MADKIQIDLEENSRYRVALDLAFRIAHVEGKSNDGDRKYWLDLYQRCRSVVVNGHTAAFALEQPD